MTESFSYAPVPKEIDTTRQWIEQETIGRGFCPPLIKLAERYRDEQGVINWDDLSQEVDIVSYHNRKPSDSGLMSDVTSNYLSFVLDAVNGAAPHSRVFILPDFDRNADYDSFMTTMKINAVNTLTTTKQGLRLASVAFERAAQNQGVDQNLVTEVLKDRPGTAVNLVEGAFNPVYFYGQEVQRADYFDFSDERGPVERERILARAPYYMLQVNNPFRSGELIGNLNINKLNKQNTKVALGIAPQTYEVVMRGLRKP